MRIPAPAHWIGALFGVRDVSSSQTAVSRFGLTAEQSDVCEFLFGAQVEDADQALVRGVGIAGDDDHPAG